MVGVGRFVEAVGGGLFAQLLRRGSEVEESPTVMGRETDRALAVLAELVGEVPPASWRVIVDGRDCSGEYLAVEVLNVRFAGPNVPIAPDADPGDSLLDVALIGEGHRAPMAAYVQGRLALASGTMPPPRVVRGRSIELGPPAGVPLRLDDEPLEAGERLMIRCLAGAASVVVEPRDRARTGATDQRRCR
jgi:diacylglycerol kinase (ATP)